MSSEERIDTAPSVQRVDAYEEALGCGSDVERDFCRRHGRLVLLADGANYRCPSAVAAAHVEATEVARLTETLDRVRELAEEWDRELGQDRCPSCRVDLLSGTCDHAEGYHHALTELRAALGDQP